MEAARPDVELGAAARLPDPVCKRDGFVAEDLRAPCLNVGGRQAGEVGGTRRCRIDRYVGGAAAVTEQRCPSGVVPGAIPDPAAADLPRGDGVVSIIEHGPSEEQWGRQRPTAIRGERRGPRAGAAASAVSADEQPSWVEAELVSAAGEPLQSR